MPDKSLEAPARLRANRAKGTSVVFCSFFYTLKNRLRETEKMKFVIVTNNPKVRDELGQEFDVDYADITYREILCKVRDMIYEGHKLLTHPLSGSVKPNETPYKSILVAKKTGTMDVQDASIIENSIITADKFSVKFPEMPQSVREDFQLIDSTLIRSALMSIPDIF